MKNPRFTVLAALILLALAIPLANARTWNDNQGNDNSNRTTGAVYIMTNDPAGNQVIRYDRANDGSLAFSGKFSTGGLGATGLTGSNQGGLVLSSNGRTLLVVNAGSNDISIFQVHQNILSLTDKTSSHGIMPISLTLHNRLVYVLNAGGKDSVGNIAGYKLDSEGELTPIAGSVQPLSGITAPAQISFNPQGTVLVVTEKTTNKIDTYTVNGDGVASAPISHASSGNTPFGFAFSNRGTLIVSEAAGGTLSSYSVSNAGSLTTISGSVPDNQLAPCWVVVTENSKYTYTTNAHSGTISSYTVDRNGVIHLLQSIAATTGSGDIDMALTRNSGYLYVSIISSQSTQGYKVHDDGSLSWVTTITGVPAGADGLAAD
ncbi:lactonase family protein [Candidatus Bathyarchaeota archaeon]|nr:MAG: lactonase family protein [Candidatus Bathyarchaeota archaeon]